MEMLGQLAAVLAVLTLLAATLWWLRRRGPAVGGASRRGQGRLLESLERLPLGPQHTLHLIRLGSKALVVACSPSGCALVENVAWREIETGTESHATAEGRR